VRARRPGPAAVVGAAWLAGSVPFSNIAARARARVDLRDVGGGTVSGTALYEVAGFGPMAVAGACDVAKGAVGPLLAGRDRPLLAAAAATAGVAGHNWSPWLGGAGGRGISVALGALLPRAGAGTVVLALGLAGGRLCRQTGLGSFAADVALVPVVARVHGRAAAAAAGGIAAVMLAKRLAGNRPPEVADLRTYTHRLLFDRDPAPPPAAGADPAAAPDEVEVVAS
jgi:glycerol-3-phosphate acyltransferase PlsY